VLCRGRFAGVIHAHGVIAGGQRKDAVEVVAFHPVLQLAGLVAGVVALFEHGDDGNLDGNGCGLRAQERGGRQKCGEGEDAELH